MFDFVIPYYNMSLKLCRSCEVQQRGSRIEELYGQTGALLWFQVYSRERRKKFALQWKFQIVSICRTNGENKNSYKIKLILLS